jgi:hypothetical protein
MYLGKSPLKSDRKNVQGGYVRLDTEWFYKITHYDRMNPFFMTVVSDSDHWMFLSSNGALTAGRKNPDHALFPYYTDDKIQDNADITGSKTIIFVEYGKNCFLWEPFSMRYQGLYDISRNIYKNLCGNKIVFEEINHDLNISLHYAWLHGERFGFIKKTKIVNHGVRTVSVNLLDGIQNILPHGISQRFQAEYSTLVDAYKKNELEPAVGLGLYSLSSIPVDKAEPSESLKATIAWSTGIEVKNILLSSRQLDSFRQGATSEQETDTRGVRGAYFINAKIDLLPQEQKTWYIVADVDRDRADVVALTRMLVQNRNLIQTIKEDVDQGTKNLMRIVARADGLQNSADLSNTARHFSNVLFNVLRGGYFYDDYLIDTSDFISFIHDANKIVYKKCLTFLKKLPPRIDYSQLISRCAKENDLNLQRLGYEYLPLTFSRRHGDPSRPWNWFSIDIKDEQGNKKLNYQGNWRDIFQNWEALVLSFPDYIESMICKFFNASTVDGYNPYRITRAGFEWEELDPADAWSYIGYWGDHQIIYLLKFLELSQKYHPGRLLSLLTRDIFVYAHIPYRIKSYPEILTDPHTTVDFDREREHTVKQRVRDLGNDGKLVWTRQNKIYHVNLTEKLLVPILSKISNFIPEAGIWMNTQRPEWNDANNALVGHGVSMVTLYYLRRHITFCGRLFKTIEDKSILLSSEAAEWFRAVFKILLNNRDLLTGPISDRERKSLLDQWGKAGSDYRSKIYSQSFSAGKKRIKPEELVQFCELLLEYIDHSIRANKRQDRLYHAYNLMKVVNQNAIAIRPLYEMLEGQVAILSSGFLSAQEAIQVLVTLKNSRLYRRDQNTYILYPDRQLPRFIDKNNIPRNAFQRSELLKSLIATGDETVVKQDVEGGIHFNGSFRNAADLKQALDNLRHDDLRPVVEKEKGYVLKIFEDLFDHESFTGRSGTFYKYEGLGCIYWHMVSKLLLAVQENYYRALADKEDEKIVSQLHTLYYEIRSGLGVAKSPELYGGFPADPYSHTPGHSGAQQPGMTGQVKEDIISRFGELGIEVHHGKITFNPGLLRQKEFVTKSGAFTLYDIHNSRVTINLPPGSLAFTVVQVPVVYHASAVEKIVITMDGNKTKSVTGLTLPKNMCTSIFNRRGKIKQLDVFIKIRQHERC